MTSNPVPPALGQILDRALEALDATELRAVIRSVAAARPDVSTELLELCARTLGHGRFFTPDPSLIPDAQRLLKAAKRRGAVDPAALRELCGRARHELLRGAAADARLAYEVLFGLGPDAELAGEDGETFADAVADGVAGSYLLAVFASEAQAKRASALLDAVERVSAITPLPRPLAALEGAWLRPPPDFAAFTGEWVAQLHAIAEGARRSLVHAHVDALLAEGLERLEGVGGLARMARRSRDWVHYRSWLSRLFELGRVREAIDVVEEGDAASLDPYSRGLLLDAGAAFARALHDAPRELAYLERALWADPSVSRLCRFLLADEPSRAVLSARLAALAADARASGLSARMRALTAALASSLGELAALLEAAPRDWGDDAHPGPVAFPALLLALYDGPTATNAVTRCCAGLFGAKGGIDWRGFVPPRELDGAVPIPDPGPAIVLALRTDPRESLELSEIATVLRGVAAAAIAHALERRDRERFELVALLVVAAAEATYQVGQEELARAYLGELAHACSRQAALRGALTRTLARSSLVNEL